MVSVFVIGATGYVGRTLTATLRHHNHRVYGLARTEEKAKLLVKSEVIPVTGETPAEYLKHVNELGIDVVVDLSGFEPTTRAVLDQLSHLSKQRIENDSLSKIGFVYASGLWVYGSGYDLVNENISVKKSRPERPVPPFVTKRIPLENTIVGYRDSLDVLIIRLPIVFGRESWVWSFLFKQVYAALQKKQDHVSVPVKEGLYTGFMHNDDLGMFLTKAVEKVHVVSNSDSYPVFNLGHHYVNVNDLIRRGAKHLGYNGEITFVDPKPETDGPFIVAFSTSINTTAEKAKHAFDYQPVRNSPLQEVDIFIKAWEANLK